MNHVVVKLRTRERENKYRKVISDISIFDLPDDLENAVSYTPLHNLDEDSWFVISDLSTKEYCLPVLTKDFVSTEFDIFTKDDFSKLDFLISFENNNQYYFQKISRMPLLSKKA